MMIRKLSDYDVSVFARAQAAIVVDLETGCWLWTHSLYAGGYARLGYRARNRLAHRVFYEIFVGPIPDGYQLDHVCHTRDASCLGGDSCRHRRCVNPSHLEPVTSRENVHRSGNAAATLATRSHCSNGHPFEGKNLRFEGNIRRCRACKRERARRDYHRKAAQ